MNESKIAILLSTYNGEGYLKEQLDSILDQTHTDWALYVRDDGSTDRTLAILKQYASEYDNIYIMDDVVHRDACYSFLWMLNEVDSDYYMFCDQDDVWIDNKIEISYKAMITQEKQTPCIPIVVNTDLVVVDSELRNINPSFWRYAKINPYPLNSYNYIVTNYLTGCTMLFNRYAKDVSFKLNNYILMHDYWVALNVLHNDGLVIPLPLKTVLYRQHGSNKLGAVKSNISVRSKMHDIRTIYTYNKNLFKMVNSVTGVSLMFFLKRKFFVYLTNIIN
ncbi:MAG: glycosyltransferase family 2 protein [Paludibacter sp.]|nr:glycosyltransferase family 2 protein [Paludibacter sp.]